MFSVVNSVLLRPLPFKNPDELVWVWSRRPDNNRAPFSLPDFLDYRDQNQTMEIAAFANFGISLAGSERTERLQGLRVSANLFQVLGVDAKLGRLMVSQDDEPDQRHVVVLTYECWRQRFAGEEQIVGRTLSLNGESYGVIGVLPKGISLPNPEAELAIPLAPAIDPLRDARNSTNFLRAIARLKPGATRSQAESELNAIVARQRQQYGDSYAKKIGINLVPFYQEVVGTVRTGLLVLFSAIGLVLLIACSNLAALSLTRATSRYQEIAIKKALGATSTRLISQLLTESLILAFLGSTGGILLATLGVQALLSLSPISLPRFQEIGIDFRALAFASGASVISTVFLGVLPALQGARIETSSVLRGSSRGAGEGARLNRWRSVLAVVEVALCCILLISAGLLLRSFLRVQSVQPGFDPTNTLSVRLSLPKLKYKDRAATTSFGERLQEALQSLPGVEEVGAVSILPMSGSMVTINFSVNGRAISPHDTHSAQLRTASIGYFRAMGIPLLQGRPFDGHDKADSLPVALINEAMAHRLWPNGDAIGSQISIDDNNTGPRPIQISGIVGNVKQLGLESDHTFDIYLPIAQIHEDNVGMITNSQYWVVRSASENRSLETAFIGTLQKIDRDIATSNMKPLDFYLSESTASRRFSLRIVSTFAGAALLLAITGIYGVISYTVTQRTPEIGIRLALGAGNARVFQLILWQGVKVVLLGLLLGISAAVALTRLIQSLLFGVTPSDLSTFVVVSIMLMVVTLAACGIPARRATKIDPLTALRNE